MSDIVIVAGARTPMGGFQGSLAGVSAVDLGAVVIREAVQRAGIAAEDVQEVIMGCVLPAGLKQGPARQAALAAGLPAATGCTTINKLCGSGMKAVMLAHDLLKAGTNQVMVAGGMESMSNAPYVLEKARSGLRMGHGEIKDHMFLDGLEKIPSLRPAFRKDGTITAANASSISDGASALVLMTAEEAQRRGLKPLARIVGHATQSQDPSEFTLAPIGAMTNLFARTGWSKDDVDLFEINEAFAMVTMLAMREHGLDHAKVNVYGGACAQGHPVGSTGSRIILTLINALRQKGGKRGVASLCIGGGEATAVALELL
ncbi:thiolase family protein [Pseudomonas aeruginosa]|uniref:thiolase family protein n=1 Tax=Pseudomonas aeruginosa TaxID=287 RepID=UPI0015E6AA82|nr:acetyl-CoA C-acetyltransferase [Pseudomonas aeruginosa]